LKTVAFGTLGCKVNFYDTEAIAHLFRQAGYDIVDLDALADVYVINTCTVTNTGDKKSRQLIRRAIRRNPDAVIAVTGCYAQTSPAEIWRIPGVDVVIGTQGREQLVTIVEHVAQTRQPVQAVTNIRKTRQFEELDVPSFGDRTRAFLKIQEGCNNFCTFCIIPWSRGTLRSRAPEHVIAQARQLVEAGYTEIVLTGIHTAGYGEDMEQYRFAHLLADLARDVPDLQRLRISSIEASQVTDEVLDVLMSNRTFCRHLHIPLQAGHDDVLRRMRRKYTTMEYARTIERIRTRWPEVAITTDVITGFPGETQHMFVDGARFMRDIGFAQMHVFPYSQRTGTVAARLPDQHTEQTKHERVQQLIALSERMQYDYARQFIGQQFDCLIEREAKGRPSGWYSGYTDNYLPTVVHAPEPVIGAPLRVQIVAVESGACIGARVG
jgi:threonylcarbamoyladenosine tRNA methylthiotransferase MtaB